MRFVVICMVCFGGLFAKSPFRGNSFDMQVLAEKNTIKTERNFTVDELSKTNEVEFNISPKSFTFSFSNKWAISKHFIFITDSFVKINALNNSEESSTIKTKVTKGHFGYGIGIGLGIFTSQMNLISVGTYCENMTMNYENLVNQTNDNEVEGGSDKSVDNQKYSKTKFANGIKIENLTAISKNKFIKIGVYKLFNDTVAVFGENHKESSVSIGLGISFMF